MRVLWLTNIMMQDYLEYFNMPVTGTGFWMHSLVSPLSKRVDKLGIVYAGCNCLNHELMINGIDYFTIKQSKISQVFNIGSSRDEEKCLKSIVSVIKKFRPDIIHIHGTERFYGRLKVENFTNIPVVISIQGIMSECAKYAWGDKSVIDIFYMINLNEIIHLFPTLFRKRKYITNAKREEKIIKNVDAILGRTDWDRSYVYKIAPNAKYYSVNELMRSQFYKSCWEFKKCQRYTIYTSGRINFMKGIHVLIEAILILKNQYKNVFLCIAGTVTKSLEFDYCNMLIKKLNLQNNVKFVGYIGENQIVKQLLSSNCYVNSSFIENGCNALQEAMLIGCPCVATYTGGMVTTLRHYETGLMAPIGSPHLLASMIQKIFDNEDLACQLGSNARKVALERHNYEQVLDSLIKSYSLVINDYSV